VRNIEMGRGNRGRSRRRGHSGGNRAVVGRPDADLAFLNEGLVNLLECTLSLFRGGEGYEAVSARLAVGATRDVGLFDCEALENLVEATVIDNVRKVSHKQGGARLLTSGWDARRAKRTRGTSGREISHWHRPANRTSRSSYIEPTTLEFGLVELCDDLLLLGLICEGDQRETHAGPILTTRDAGGIG
jgi:hypothetical protein